MTVRLVDGANNAAKNADARAPLSSYLRDETLTDSQEGWTVVSSDDESDPVRTPNLSVLKQIKNFLNAKSGEPDVPFDSSARRFRVDYPYYAPDAEKESPSPNLDESPSAPSFVPAKSLDKAVDSSTVEIEQNTVSFGKIASISDRRSESTDTIPVLIHCEDNGTETAGKSEKANEGGQNRVETIATLTTDGLGREKNDDFVCSPAPQEMTSETPLPKTTTQTPNYLDVAEISGINYSDVKKPMFYNKIGEECESTETVVEKPFVSSTELTSTRSLQSFDSFEKSREEKPLVDGNASRTIVQREKNNSRLSIFRRFVDLVTTRNGTEFNNQNLNNHDLSPKEAVDALTREDYSREICICDAYDSASSMEVLVAPCYSGTNMTFQR